MSLIVTHISKLGLVHLTDSALTLNNSKTGERVDGGDTQKLFEVPGLRPFYRTHSCIPSACSRSNSSGLRYPRLEWSLLEL